MDYKWPGFKLSGKPINVKSISAEQFSKQIQNYLTSIRDELIVSLKKINDELNEISKDQYERQIGDGAYFKDINKLKANQKECKIDLVLINNQINQIQMLTQIYEKED